jgi:hypothetical protein
MLCIFAKMKNTPLPGGRWQHCSKSGFKTGMIIAEYSKNIRGIVPKTSGYRF